MGLVTGNVKVAGLEGFSQNLGKAPAPDSWSIFIWDDTIKAWVNLCPEPQATEQEAITTAEAIIADPLRYGRCLVAAAHSFYEETQNRASREMGNLAVRISTLESIIAKAIQKPAVPEALPDRSVTTGQPI